MTSTTSTMVANVVNEMRAWLRDCGMPFHLRTSRTIRLVRDNYDAGSACPVEWFVRSVLTPGEFAACGYDVKEELISRMAEKI